MKPQTGSLTKASSFLFMAICAVLTVGIRPQPASAIPAVNNIANDVSESFIPSVTTSTDLTDDFVITVKTDNAGTSSDTQFTIPTTGSGYDYNVDCDNDGNDEFTGADGDYTCDYGAGNEGTYTVRIKDNSGYGTGFPRIYFNDSGDKYKLLTIEQW